MTQMISLVGCGQFYLLDWAVRFLGLVFGIGLSCSSVNNFIGDMVYDDSNEDIDVYINSIVFLWIFSTTFMYRRVDTFKTISVGLGLKFFNPLITIGWST